MSDGRGGNQAAGFQASMMISPGKKQHGQWCLVLKDASVDGRGSRGHERSFNFKLGCRQLNHQREAPTSMPPSQHPGCRGRCDAPVKVTPVAARCSASCLPWPQLPSARQGPLHSLIVPSQFWPTSATTPSRFRPNHPASQVTQHSEPFCLESASSSAYPRLSHRFNTPTCICQSVTRPPPYVVRHPPDPGSQPRCPERSPRSHGLTPQP
jgi:hypothetical protein